MMESIQVKNINDHIDAKQKVSTVKKICVLHEEF